MKILIACDGCECSDAAIMDLRRAGLPAVAEALVLTAAEISPLVAAVPCGAEVAGPGIFLPEQLEGEAPMGHQLQEAEAFAARVADRLRAGFPRWHINSEAWAGAAGSNIIRQGHAWGPDLVVVGSHGRSGISRLFLGSVSERVLHHVNCSVRIGRQHLHSRDRAIRLLIAVDGSNNAMTAVKAVAARNWPAGTEARAVGVLDSRVAIAAATTLEGTIPVAIEEKCRRRLSEAVHEAARDLARSGLRATHQVLAGQPDEVLLAEAEEWAADCVFIGARGLNVVERFVLGSVSTAVASRAHCSVEVVKTKVA